ncbi:MAG: repeat-containing protein, partial [Verrucomicrobiales bacterium]|nr:repeat-containing protein [Verrucomicrobiales bacterium]
GKQNGFLKVAAGMLGVSFEDLRQRDEERQHKLRITYGAAAAALLIILGGLSTELYFQKNEAVQASTRAESARETAERERKKADEEKKATEVANSAAQDALEKERKATKEAKDALEQAEVAKQREEKQHKEADEARHRAEDSEKRAIASEADAKESESTALRALAFSDFAFATRLIEEDHNGKALAYLSRALRSDPDNATVITRIISLLSQRNWPLQVLPPLKHDAEVKSVTFSPDGTKLLTTSGNVARFWDANTGKLLMAPLEHRGLITSAEFSEDGRWLITASRDNTAQVWDTTTGKSAGTPLKHEDWVSSACFSQDGKLVVTASQDKIARVWERATGRIIVSLQHDAPLKTARFSPDGNQVLVASTRSYARLWDINSGVPIGANMTHQGGLTSAIFSPDGKWIATASGDGTARIWRAGAGAPVSPPLDHVNWINGAKFSPDGKFLATVSSDNTARIWDVPDGKPVTPPLKHDGAIAGVNFSPNGRWLVTASGDGTARVWNTTTGKPVCEPLRHTGSVLEAAFNHDGNKVVTASADRTARIWEIADNRPTSEPLKHDQWVNAAAFSSDAKFVATVSSDRSARIWNSVSGEPVTGSLKHRGEGEVVSCCFDIGGTILLAGCSDGALCAWDITTEKLIYERAGQDVRMNSIILAPDGKTFFTSSDAVRHWDLKSGTLVSEPLRHETAVKCAALSPDASWMATAAQDRIVRVWNMGTGQQKFTLQHSGEVQSLAISPDGKWLATATDDKDGNAVRVWDAATGKVLMENLRHDGPASLVAFVPQPVWNREKNPHKWLLTISEKTARVWDLESGKAATEPIAHDQIIKTAAFSPDGNFIVTASDKIARVWETSTGRAVAEPFQHDGAIRFAAFSPDSSSFITTSADKTARLWFLRMPGRAPAWLSQFSSAIGGHHLADSGATELVQDGWSELSKSKAMLAEDPAEQFGAWARWFTSDHALRTTSPFAKTSLKRYVARKIYDGSAESLQQALDLEPNNPLALVKLARLTPNAEQADFLSKLGEGYDPENPEVLWIRAQVLQQILKMAEAYEVMQRAIALDSRNLHSFDASGGAIKVTNKDENLSQGWLPKGWLDNNSALPISVSYSKINDLPQNVLVGFGINVDARSHGWAELCGPRFICKRNIRCTIEGWARSESKSDLTVALCQFIDPNEKLKEQVFRTTPEWKPFKLQFIPQQDVAAELRIYEIAGAAVDIAGIKVREE